MTNKPLTLVEALAQQVGIEMNTQMQPRPPMTLIDIINRSNLKFYIHVKIPF